MPAQLLNQFVSRPKVQVVRIGEKNLHTEIVRQVALGQTFHSRLSAHRHEDRGLDGTVRRVQKSRAGASFGALGLHFECDLRQL